MCLTRLRFQSEILGEHWLWTQTVCLLRTSIEIEDLPFVVTNGLLAEIVHRSSSCVFGSTSALLAKILHRQFHTK